jgi:hypothetical protein
MWSFITSLLGLTCAVAPRRLCIFAREAGHDQNFIVGPPRLNGLPVPCRTLQTVWPAQLCEWERSPAACTAWHRMAPHGMVAQGSAGQRIPARRIAKSKKHSVSQTVEAIPRGVTRRLAGDKYHRDRDWPAAYQVLLMQR